MGNLWISSKEKRCATCQRQIQPMQIRRELLCPQQIRPIQTQRRKLLKWNGEHVSNVYCEMCWNTISTNYVPWLGKSGKADIWLRSGFLFRLKYKRPSIHELANMINANFKPLTLLKLILDYIPSIDYYFMPLQDVTPAACLQLRILLWHSQYAEYYFIAPSTTPPGGSEISLESVYLSCESRIPTFQHQGLPEMIYLDFAQTCRSIDMVYDEFFEIPPFYLGIPPKI